MENNEYMVLLQLEMLSRLYDLLCDCRKNYEELVDLLNPNFHLDDCPYYEKINPLNIDFK